MTEPTTTTTPTKRHKRYPRYPQCAPSIQYRCSREHAIALNNLKHALGLNNLIELAELAIITLAQSKGFVMPPKGSTKPWTEPRLHKPGHPGYGRQKKRVASQESG